MNIKSFFSHWTLARIINTKMMKNPFKKYRPLQVGNSKLFGSILNWSLLPITTCGRSCEGCYDLRSFRYVTVQLKRLYNTWRAIHDADNLKQEIINQIIRSKKRKYVRIHVGGDFFSFEYVQMWAEIVQAVNDVRDDITFYCYTKTKFQDELEMCGIIVNPSLIKGLGNNYGKREKLESFIAENDGYIICPATKKETKGQTKCGLTCTSCMTNKETVLFVEH